MKGARHDVEQEAHDGSVDGPAPKPFIGRITKDAFLEADAAHDRKSVET